MRLAPTFLIVIVVMLTFGACKKGGGSSTDNTTDTSGSSGSSSTTTTTLEMILPVDAGEVVFTGPVQNGIWPYGPRGGDHPEGHGGIDFQVSQGTPIMAAAAGSVGSVSDSVYPGERSISVYHGNYTTYYTGFFQQIYVAKGDKVERGAVMGTADFWIGSTTAWLHFGLVISSTRKTVCPGDFFTPEAFTALQNLLEQATYPDKDIYPDICNPCPDCE